jgi:hypothetical protein
MRLIDADALLEKHIFENTALRHINDAPTVDTRPVVHGEWERIDHDGSWKVCACSVCKKRTNFVNYTEAYNFCPNCGAKMNNDS